MKIDLFGLSSLSFPIFMHSFLKEGARRPVLIMGGVHGNEPEGVIAAQALMGRLIQNFSYSFSVHILPIFNPDGFFSSTRCNGNAVDLNRNLPTKDWSPEAFSPKYPPGKFANSEVENQALTQWLDKYRPGLILSLHSFEKFMMNVNGNCLQYAGEMQKLNQYPIEESIGYPTPGCLGTYAGIERDMPTITYEIERGLSFDQIRGIHVSALIKALEVYDRSL